MACTHTLKIIKPGLHSHIHPEHLFFYFLTLIARLANLSFNQGQFPSDFKIAQITPLLKKPNLDTTNPANYRLISNLNNISKIIERLFRFRSGHSSHLLLCSTHTSRRTAKATQQKLLYCSLLITSGSLPIVVNPPSWSHWI